MDNEEGDNEEETGTDDDKEETGGWEQRGSNNELAQRRNWGGKSTKGNPVSGRPRWYVTKTNNDFGRSSFSLFLPFLRATDRLHTQYQQYNPTTKRAQRRPNNRTHTIQQRPATQATTQQHTHTTRQPDPHHPFTQRRHRR
jgi:hypothetical protein